MNDSYFNFTYKGKGQTREFALPYNPLEYGFSLDLHKKCCLYFSKDGKELRIKTETGVVIVYDEKKRPITQGAKVPRSKRSFENILKECSLL